MRIERTKIGGPRRIVTVAPEQQGSVKEIHYNEDVLLSLQLSVYDEKGYMVTVVLTHLDMVEIQEFTGWRLALAAPKKGD